MPRAKLENLITELHDMFGDDETSPQQAQLLQDMRNHLHALDEPEPEDPGIVESAEIMLKMVELEHPKAAEVLKKILHVMEDIGI